MVEGGGGSSNASFMGNGGVQNDEKIVLRNESMRFRYSSQLLDHSIILPRKVAIP